jgi:LysM repeat protein
MSIRRWSEYFIRTFLVIGIVLLFSACAKQIGKTAVVEQPSEAKKEEIKQPTTEAKSQADKQIGLEQKQAAESSSAAVQEQAGESGAVSKKKTDLLNTYTVRRGDSLWWIAKYKDHYNDPYLWPLIYKANKNLIKNPDLIYPGQKFKIPRTGFRMEDIKRERKKAGAQRPYMPPRNSNPPVN